jgi:hypothetical protein
MFGVSQRVMMGASGGAAGPFAANAVHFDGTNDNLLRGAQLTGAVDSENILWSIWFNITGGDGSQMYLVHTVGGVFFLLRNSNNKFLVRMMSASTALWQWQLDGLFTEVTDNPGWHHLLISAQFAATPIVRVYLDDNVASISESVTPIEGDIDWTVDDYAWGSTTDEATRYNGDMAEMYLTNEYLDISVEANRRKFIDASGKPVDLGADGSLPTGTAPLVYFSGDTNSWHINKGSGGGFTETGALTDASSSPSD